MASVIMCCDLTFPTASKAHDILSTSREDNDFLFCPFLQKARLGVGAGGAWMSPRDFLLYLCSNYTQKEDLPRVIIFPLPFRPALTNFKDSIMKKAFKTHMYRIALESANACGALCWLEQQAGGCFITYQWFGFVNEKFRGNCIILNSDYHRGRDASDIPMQWVSTILMEICWNQRSLPPREKNDERLQERYFIFEMKDLFSEVVSFIRTVPSPACYGCAMPMYHSSSLLSSCLCP